jgi:hypothetical protein
MKVSLLTSSISQKTRKSIGKFLLDLRTFCDMLCVLEQVQRSKQP